MFAKLNEIPLFVELFKYLECQHCTVPDLRSVLASVRTRCRANSPTQLLVLGQLISVESPPQRRSHYCLHLLTPLSYFILGSRALGRAVCARSEQRGLGA